MSVQHRTTDNYLQRIHDDTHRYLAELKSHNDWLRVQAAALQQECSRLQREKAELQGRLSRVTEEVAVYERERNAVLERLMSVELQNQQEAEHFLEIAARNMKLATFQIATYALRATLNRADVLAALRHIVTNLLGSNDFAIYERAEDSDFLEMIDASAGRTAARERFRLGEGILGVIAQAGEPCLSPHRGSSGATACIPLKVGQTVTGAIAIFGLPSDKAEALAALDRELLDLIATQAGVALHCSRLHQRAAPIAEQRVADLLSAR
jgi:GAF domain-containing protein